MKRFAFNIGVAALLTGAWAHAGTFSFETVNFPEDTFTQLLGINDASVIAGYHGSGATGHPNKGFVLTLPKSFVSENFKDSAQTQVIGINNAGNTDGFYIDQAGVTHGFLRRGGEFMTVDFPGTTFNQLLGLNTEQQAVGYFADANNIDHAYIYEENGGVFLEFTIPNASGGAQATGINMTGEVCGFYIDGAGTNHGFTLNRGTFTKLDVPESMFTQALGLNNNGQVVGAFMDKSGMTHGFLYSGGSFEQIDDPNGFGTTTVNGINNTGRIVGFYVDSAGNTDGFVGWRN
jgi:probable HAF family extracellular repeat protein